MLDKIIRLVAEHGDRFVLADKDSGRAVAIMDLAMYEALLEGKGPSSAAPTLPTAPPKPAPAPRQPEPRPEKPLQNRHKIAAQGQNTIATTADLSSLTETELMDKISRDIGEWKNAQETKRTEELQSVARNSHRHVPPAAPKGGMDDEERYFLEPIE